MSSISSLFTFCEFAAVASEEAIVYTGNYPYTSFLKRRCMTVSFFSLWVTRDPQLRIIT